MTLLLLVLMLIALVVSAIAVNKRQQREAIEGVRFTVARPEADVLLALDEIYTGSVKAAARSMFSSIQVSPDGDSRLRFESKHGDGGTISVKADGETKTEIVIAADRLFTGLKGYYTREGLWGKSMLRSSLLLSLFGYAPNVKKVRRFERSVEKLVRKKLGSVEAPAHATPGTV